MSNLTTLTIILSKVLAKEIKQDKENKIYLNQNMRSKNVVICK